MKESDIIQECLKEIEIKTGWGNYTLWKVSQYEELSDLIWAVSKIRISSTTLRRLFGKIKTEKIDYIPQIETKNALAIYLGFDNWYKYLESKKPKTRNRKPIISLASVFIFIACGVVIYTIFNTKTTIPKYTFKHLQTAENTVPNDVVFNYDVSKFEEDVFIDFGDKIIPTKGKMIFVKKLLPKDKSVISHTYRTPRPCKAFLVYKDEKIDSISLFFKTTKWEAFVEQKELILKYSEDEIISDGKLTVNQIPFCDQGIDCKTKYRLYYWNSENFNLDLDNFKLITNFRSQEFRNRIEFNVVQISLWGENRRILLTFTNKGFQDKVTIQLSEKRLKGEDHNLLNFRIKLDQWNKLEIGNKDKKIKVLLNNKLILKDEYSASLGKLKAISYEFHASGQIDDLIMWDKNNKVVYDNKFE